MITIPVIAQIIGIIGMVFNILSFQCKKNKHLVLALGTGSLLFSFNYLLLGAFSSAGFNIINILRSASVLNKKTHNNAVFAGICLLYTAVTVFTYEDFWSIILLASQLAAVYAILYKNGGFIRKIQFFVVSPVWLINNIFMAFTIGGIICEVFTIISVIVSFIRYGKNGFDA